MSILKKQEIDELVDPEGGMISGDRNVVNNKEIETGPTPKPWNDNSDYEKGVATTTDRATRYRQNIPWFAVYSYRSSTGRGLPVNEKKVLTKQQIEEEITEELVKKHKKDREMLEKNFDGKFEKIVDTISDSSFNKEQLEKIKKIVLDKINEKNA